MFDDCILGGTYFKDFSIWNRSEIDLYFVLTLISSSSSNTNNKSEDSWIKFTDYDTGEPLTSKPVTSYSPRRVRVTFKPKDVGDYIYDIQIESMEGV
jgi:hypothetical protein